MKKYYLFGGLAAATALVAAATSFAAATSGVEPMAADAYEIPFYSPTAMSSSSLTSDWTVINNNDDNSTWVPKDATSSPSGNSYDAGVSYSKYNDGDDYLISPKIHFEAGIEYVILYNWKGSSSSAKEKLSVYLSKSNNSANDINADKILVHDAGEGENTGSKYVAVTEKVTLEEEGDYYVVFHFHSPADLYTVYLADLLVAKNEFAPAAVTKLTATAAPERELKCSLSWVLPTTDQFGIALTADQTISAVKVYRDDETEPIATLDGTATSFDDTAATGLTSGKHTYGVVVVVNDVESPIAKVGPTSYVGPIEPTAVPVTFKTDNLDDFNLWSQAKADDATSTAEWAFQSSYSVADLNSYSNKSNSWFITPPVEITEAGTYRIGTALACNANGGGGHIRFEYGLSATPTDMTPIYSEEYFAVPYSSVSATLATWPDIIYKDVQIPAPGTYYFAIHNDDAASIRYYLKYLSVEQTEQTPQAVTKMTATAAADESLNIDVAWTNPTKTVDGSDLNAGDYQVDIYLNDSETPAASVTDGSESCRVAVPEAGVYTVSVKAAAAATGATLPTFPSVTTSWVGSKNVSLPYSTEFSVSDPTNAIWEAVDVNADGKTFVYELLETFYSTTTSFAISSVKNFNDYLISPAVELTPGFYQVSLTHKGGGYSDHLNVTLGIVKKGQFNKDAENLGMVSVQNITDFYEPSNAEENYMFHIDEAGEYQVVYGLNQTTSYNTSLELHAFGIKAETAYPADVTALTATADADNENAVDLSWVNPDKYFGVDFALTEIEAVVVERDGQVIATITEGMEPGAAAAYKDENVPNGTHTYSVYATIGGQAHEGDHASVMSPWIGGGVSAPFSCTETFPGWFSDDAWTFKENSFTPANSYWGLIEQDKTATHDDHLVTCPLNIKDKTIYSLEFECSGGNYGLKNDIAVKMGTGDNHKEFKQVGTINIPDGRSLNTFEMHKIYIVVGTDDEPVQAMFKPVMRAAADNVNLDQLYAQAGKVEAGDNRIALHLTEPGGTKIKSFSFAKVADYDPTPTAIEEISADKVSVNNGIVSFPGTATVEVFNLSGACVASAGNANGSFNIGNLAAGFYLVKVTTATGTTTLKVNNK